MEEKPPNSGHAKTGPKASKSERIARRRDVEEMLTAAMTDNKIAETLSVKHGVTRWQIRKDIDIVIERLTAHETKRSPAQRRDLMRRRLQATWRAAIRAGDHGPAVQALNVECRIDGLNEPAKVTIVHDLRRDASAELERLDNNQLEALRDIALRLEESRAPSDDEAEAVH